MSDFGFASWSENGTPNNYGIKPVTVIQSISLALNQKTGTYAFTVPSGYKLGFIFVPVGADSYVAGRRIITVSGSSIVMTAGTDNSLNQFQACQASLVVFLEAA